MRRMTERREPSPNKQRTAVYARIASHPFDGWLEYQIFPVKTMIEEKDDLILTAVYADEGIAANQPRPQLEAMLAACDAGEIDVVVAASISRLARGMSDLARIIERLYGSNTKLLLLQEGISVDELAHIAQLAGIVERCV
jgi:site-specific DNA recombinase